jgi:hypothetical protein
VGTGIEDIGGGVNEDSSMSVLRIQGASVQVVLRYRAHKAKTDFHEGNTLQPLPMDKPVKPFLVAHNPQVEAQRRQYDD